MDAAPHQPIGGDGHPTGGHRGNEVIEDPIRHVLSAKEKEGGWVQQNLKIVSVLQRVTVQQSAIKCTWVVGWVEHA